MTQTLDHIMEQASHALVRMDYLSCETLCLQALAQARQKANWPYYARILLPLQEARRQRRMIAADGVIRLGTTDGEAPDAWLSSLQAGCIVITHPYRAQHACILDEKARAERHHVEVLYADNRITADAWTLRSFKGPSISCMIPAPPRAWQDNWLAPGESPDPEPEADIDPATTPADWFIDATEALGDAALEHVDTPLGDIARIEQLEQMLQVVTDHEILHQRLADAARAMQ